MDKVCNACKNYGKDDVCNTCNVIMNSEREPICLPSNWEGKEPAESYEAGQMTSEIFQTLLDELDGNSLETLKSKNARYSSNGDSLHNFRKGADIMGGTPAQACWGYLTKHLVALRDMVQRDDFSNRDDFLEKCQDSINYIRFLWCIGNDNKSNKKEND